MSGLRVFVCGPSGAGKDSVLGWAATHLVGRQDIVFARRMVTRPAHGFHYGIAAWYADQVAAGRVVVVNGSRDHVAALEVTQHTRVVQIVTDATQLASRLEKRGRDAPHEVSQRLAREMLSSACTFIN